MKDVTARWQDVTARWQDVTARARDTKRSIQVPHCLVEVVDRARLLEIAARVRACQACPLGQGRAHAVPGEGGGVFGHEATNLTDFAQGDGVAWPDAVAPDAALAGRVDPAGSAGAADVGETFSGVMLVGEAPGRNEDETGRPFCGAAGKNLDLGLAAAGLERAAVFVTSINKCRPPKNRDPTTAEKAACRPFLLEQVAALAPRVIVALGRHGLSGLVDDPPKQFSQVRGTFLDGPPGPEGQPVPVFCMLHPAAIIYRQKWKETYLEDWRRLGAWLRGEPVWGLPPA